MRAPRSPVVLALLALVAACGDGGAADAPAGGGGAGPVGDAAVGSVAIGIEEVEGILIEGFEVGLRLEAPDGEVLAATLWSDVAGADPYTAVWEQEVPAGEVVVRAQVELGIGPPPATPDLDGDLPCRLPVTVADGTRVEVEVALTSDDTCLRPAG